MLASLRDPDLPILVGVDAGATKTVAVAVHPGGARVGRAATEGANPKRHELDVAADRIAAAVAGASPRAAADRIAAAVTDASPRAAPDAAPQPRAGTAALRTRAGAVEDAVPALVLVAGAGIDRPEHARALEDALVQRLPGVRIVVVNDTLAVLRAGTPDAVGLVVPVSTGGNVIGRAADGRVTDRGHGIFGGGYVLGALAARAARRGPGAGVTAPVVGRVHPELAAQVEAAHLAWRGRRPEPGAARLGAAVVAAAQAGDPYPARMVVRWCGRIEAAVREEAERLELGREPVVVVYGGLFDASPWLASRVREAVRRGVPGARIRALEAEPVDGAVLLALDAWAGHPVGWDFVPRR